LSAHEDLYLDSPHTIVVLRERSITPASFICCATSPASFICCATSLSSSSSLERGSYQPSLTNSMRALAATHSLPSRTLREHLQHLTLVLLFSFFSPPK
jgi:hypothetical protein